MHFFEIFVDGPVVRRSKYRYSEAPVAFGEYEDGTPVTDPSEIISDWNGAPVSTDGITRADVLEAAERQGFEPFELTERS